MIELILRAQLGENNWVVRHLITKCVLSSVSKLTDVYNMDPWEKKWSAESGLWPLILIGWQECEARTTYSVLYIVKHKIHLQA